MQVKMVLTNNVLIIQKKNPLYYVYKGFFFCINLIKYYMLAVTYFSLASIIGTMVLNFCVRNENRCDHHVKPPTYKTQYISNQVFPLSLVYTTRVKVEKPLETLL